MDYQLTCADGLQVAENDASGKILVPATRYNDYAAQKPNSPLPQLPLHKRNTFDGNRGQDTVLGMGRKSFWVVFAFAGILIVGAAMGGGVGVASTVRSNADRNQTPILESATAASTTLGSTSAAAATTVISTISLSSPSSASASPTATLCSDGANFTSRFASGADGTVPGGAKLEFTIQCNKDTQPGQNVAQTVTTSLNACIDLCGSYNFWSGTGLCTGVTWMHSGSCWIKNSTLTPFKPNTGTDSASLA